MTVIVWIFLLISGGIMDKIAKYLNTNGGTGLAIDYGQDYIQGDTLRVILDYCLCMTFSSNPCNRLSKTIKSFIS